MKDKTRFFCIQRSILYCQMIIWIIDFLTFFKERDYLPLVGDPLVLTRGGLKSKKQKLSLWLICLFCMCVSASELALHTMQKKISNFSVADFCFLLLRRGRDSNPRNLAVQRFSRPPQSTTLPPLLSFGDAKICKKCNEPKKCLVVYEEIFSYIYSRQTKVVHLRILRYLRSQTQ